MALKGNLRDFSTPQLLNLINLARKTGTLTVAGNQTATVAFREGKLIFAGLGGNGSGLAHILEEAGFLTPEQGRIIETKARGTSDKQLGHLLVRAGFVSQRDIIQSIRRSSVEVVYRLFTWPDGAFNFDAGAAPPPDRITAPIDLENVIMEGTRRMAEWQQLRDEIPDLRAKLRFTADSDAVLEKISLTAEEWRIISLINQRLSLQDMATRGNLSEFQIRRIVFGMVQAGIVELIQPPRPMGTQAGMLPFEQEGQIAAGTPAVKRTVITRLIDRIRRL
jgi:hypothetical protein